MKSFKGLEEASFCRRCGQVFYELIKVGNKDVLPAKCPKDKVKTLPLMQLCKGCNNKINLVKFPICPLCGKKLRNKYPYEVSLPERNIFTIV